MYLPAWRRSSRDPRASPKPYALLQLALAVCLEGTHGPRREVELAAPPGLGLSHGISRTAVVRRKDSE